jgi:RNA polymerase sigma-70 factor (ECF subfamily)
MMHVELSDNALMALVATGDQQAFRILVVRQLPRSHAIARRMLKAPEDAEEAVQDAFGKAWKHARRFDPARAAFGTWFYRILTRTCLDMLRRKAPQHAPLDDAAEQIPDASDNPEAALMARIESGRVQSAVQSLPDRQRAAVMLCYFEDLTNPEAASAMDIHVKALEGLLSRARNSLRALLG